MTEPANHLQHSLALTHSRLWLAVCANARGMPARAVEMIDQTLVELNAQRDAIAAAHGLPAKEAACATPE